MNNREFMTIDQFNKLTGRETLHPLISIIDLSNANLNRDIRMTCDFYGLLYYVTLDGNQYSGKDKLRLIHPGEMVEIPSLEHRSTNGYTGIIFHPDLLYETSLEGRIDSYPTRCRCRGPLSEHEQQVISDSLQKIKAELHHAIDRHSASIIASHIELLLNYCVRFCNQAN